MAHVGQEVALGLAGGLGEGFCLFQFALGLLALGDVGAQGNVLGGLAVGVGEGHDGGADPVVVAVLLPVLDLAAPDLARLDGAPEVGEKCRGVVVGPDEAMVGPQYFLPAITGDVAEAVVGVGDGAVEIRDADDGVLIEGELLIGQVGMQGQQFRLMGLLALDQVADQGHQAGQAVGGLVPGLRRVGQGVPQPLRQGLELGNGGLAGLQGAA